MVDGLMGLNGLIIFRPSLKLTAKAPEKLPGSNRRGVSSNHRFSGLLNFSGVKEDRLALLDNMEDHLLLPDEVIVGAKGGKGGIWKQHIEG